MGYLIMFLVGVLAAVGTKKDHRADNDPETSKRDCHSLPGRPLTVVSIPPTPTDEERAEKKKKNRRKSIKFWAEIGGLIVLAFYTGFTYRIMKASVDAAKTANDTLGEIQKQTTLMRQQTIGTLEAIVKINGAIGLGPLPPWLDKNSNVSIGLINSGHVNAKTVNVQANLQLITTEGKRIGQVWPCNFRIPTLAPGPAVYRQCFITDFSEDALKLIADRKRFVALEGSYTYDNGFDESKEEPLCFRYSPKVNIPPYGDIGSSDQFVTCGDFVVLQEIIRRRIAEQRNNQNH